MNAVATPRPADLEQLVPGNTAAARALRAELRALIEAEVRAAGVKWECRLAEQAAEAGRSALERRRVEEALRASEERLTAIFARAAAGLSEISLEGRFERVNDELCRLLGRAREAIVGSAVLELTHPSDAVATTIAIGRLIETGQPVAVDQRWLRPDGTTVWANSMLTRLDDPAGRPRAILAVTIDLSERRDAERARLETEAKFRTLAEASPAIIWMLDPEGRGVYVNRACVDFFGHPEVAFSSSWQTLIHPDDAAHYAQNLLTALREQRPLHSRGRMQRHDGEWRWLESHALPHFGEDGVFLGLVGHSFDITETLATTAILRESEQRLRVALDTVRMGTWSLNLETGVTTADARACEILGLQPVHGNVLAQPIAARAHPMDRERVAAVIREALRPDGARFGYAEFCLVRGNGEHAQVAVAMRSLPADGAATGPLVRLTGTLLDVTARKAEEAQLSRYREDLEQRVHERMAELNEVNGALRDEIIERERAEATRQELLQQVVTAQEEERRRISRELHDEIGQHLTALLLGLKSLSRGESAGTGTLPRLEALTERIGREIHDMALRLRPTALDDLGLVRTLANFLEDWGSATRIEVDFHAKGLDGARLPPPLETALYRIAQEALNNVLKHARARRVSVLLERRDGQVSAIIEDDGCGFDVAAVTARAPRRLGLRGMRERAALARGELSIESTPGQGTTLFVRLPLAGPMQEGSHV